MPKAFAGQFVFPASARAARHGLLALGGNLKPDTLIAAYAQGIFPWYSEGDPILWWRPNPRCVLYPCQFHISKRSARKIRNSGFEYSFDTHFNQVITACAAPRAHSQGTWILPEMRLAYLQLHKLGYAHSVEIWRDGQLAGGLYGVALGGAFFGESMFRLLPEASRAALACLIFWLKNNNFSIMDCQQASPHMLAMGATQITAHKFDQELKTALQNREWSACLWRGGSDIEGLRYHVS